jgi:hypothetical protein
MPLQALGLAMYSWPFREQPIAWGKSPRRRSQSHPNGISLERVEARVPEPVASAAAKRPRAGTVMLIKLATPLYFS